MSLAMERERRAVCVRFLLSQGGVRWGLTTRAAVEEAPAVWYNGWQPHDPLTPAAGAYMNIIFVAGSIAAVLTLYVSIAMIASVRIKAMATPLEKEWADKYGYTHRLSIKITVAGNTFITISRIYHAGRFLTPVLQTFRRDGGFGHFVGIDPACVQTSVGRWVLILGWINILPLVMLVKVRPYDPA